MLFVFTQTTKKGQNNQKATCALVCLCANLFGMSASAGKHGLFCLHLSPVRIPRCEIWPRKDSRANRPFQGQTAITPVTPCDVFIHGCRPPPRSYAKTYRSVHQPDNYRARSLTESSQKPLQK